MTRKIIALSKALIICIIPAACLAQGLKIMAIANPAAAAATPIIQSSGGVQSAGAFGAFSAIAPGSWIEIYGSNLAADTRLWGGADFNGNTAPTSLDGTSVMIGGQSAFVDYISPTQVNAQVPSNVAAGSQQVIVTGPGGMSAPVSITVNSVEPGLLSPTSFNIGGQQYVTALFPDGATFVLPPGSISGVSSKRAQPGDNITLYGIGFGSVLPSTLAGQIVQQQNSLALPFHLFFGQTEAMVTYAGLAPGVVGLYQFNLVVPNVATSDAVPLSFTLNGTAGLQTLYISVQNPIVAAQIQNVTLSPASIAGGGSVQGTVTLSQPAPQGGAVISLSSSSGAATVPATVTVPAGSMSATFTVSTSTVASSQNVTITASYGGGSAQTTLALTPGNATPPFASLMCGCTFQPAGYPASQLNLQAQPNSGNVTFTATISGLPFVNGTQSGETFTFTTIGPGPAPGVPPSFGSGGLTLTVTSASFTFTIAPLAGSKSVGSLNGTLSVTGTPLLTGGAPVTLSGALTGNYLATGAP